MDQHTFSDSQAITSGHAKLTPTAELIASAVDFQQAWPVATDQEKAVLASGLSSRSVITQIAAAVLARQILARTMSLQELARYVQHLQACYEVAIGPASYARYEASVPKDLIADRAKLDAELATLSHRLRLAYGVAYKRDSGLRTIRSCCFAGLAGCLVFVLFAVVYQTWNIRSPAVLNYLLVATLGFGGAVTSIARRADQILDKAPLSEDPVFQISALQGANASLLIAVLCGPVFSLILLLIFMTGAFNIGDVTPKFASEAMAAGGLDFSVLNFKFHLAAGPDAAKLMTWSFIAGFAEQFVPDVLDQFSNASKPKH